MTDLWKREELAWAGGFFEGEGCITQYNGWSNNRRYMYPKLEVSSTDLDALERFRKCLGGLGTITRPESDKRKPDHYKPKFRWFLSSWPIVQAVVALLYPFLCTRRQARAREVLTAPIGCVETRI